MAENQQTTYFITGVNRGIGRELVKQLLSSNSNNIVIGTIRRDVSSLDSEFLITKDPRLTILRLDFGDTDTYLSVSKELERLNMGIDVFISNAALNNAKHSAMHTSPEEYHKFLTVNAIGPLEILKVLKPYLLKKETRKVVFMSSVMGSVGNFPQFLYQAFPCAPYSVSKAALNSIGVQLSYELKAEGFTVVNYDPGLINTKEHDSNDDVSASKSFKPDEHFLQYVAKNTFSVDEGVRKTLAVISGLEPADNGKFLTHDRSELTY